jgi:hypothetical protein
LRLPTCITGEGHDGMSPESGLLRDNRIRIVGGRGGVGKSECVINYALRLASLDVPVMVADLDVVNPYFTTRESRALLESRGVRVVGPSRRSTANDVPALPADLLRAFAATDVHVVVDLGGELNGTRSLGPYRDRLRETGCDFFLVINGCRPHHDSAEKVEDFAARYEDFVGLPLTGLVNNTHLMNETGEEEIRRGEKLAVRFCAKRGIPYRYLCLTETVNASVRTRAENVLLIRRWVIPWWIEREDKTERVS